jgi:hypothetical protein
LKPKIPIWVNFGVPFNGRYFYGHLVYFTAIRYILWSFGIIYGYLVYFIPFWYVGPEKSGNPVAEGCKSIKNCSSPFSTAECAKSLALSRGKTFPHVIRNQFANE